MKYFSVLFGFSLNARVTRVMILLSLEILVMFFLFSFFLFHLIRCLSILLNSKQKPVFGFVVFIVLQFINSYSNFFKLFFFCSFSWLKLLFFIWFPKVDTCAMDFRTFFFSYICI